MNDPNPEYDQLLRTSIAAASSNMAQFVEAQGRRDAEGVYATTSAMGGTSMVVMYEAAIRVLNLTPGLLALLGVTSAATQVLYARSGDHTRVRHPEHVPDVYHALPESRLEYIATKDSGLGIFQLVFSTEAGRPIFMPIKFVPSDRQANESGVDQCWARTLWFMRPGKADRWLRDQVIRRVTDQERSDVGAIHSGPI
jgi:hypothetical protein